MIWWISAEPLNVVSADPCALIQPRPSLAVLMRTIDM